MYIDLERQAKFVKDAEERWEKAKAMALNVQMNVADGERMESQILANLEAIRAEPSVSMRDYKDSLKNLNHVRQGLIRLRSYLIERDNEAAACEKALCRAIEDYRAAEHQANHTVVNVDFRSKNGQG